MKVTNRAPAKLFKGPRVQIREAQSSGLVHNDALEESSRGRVCGAQFEDVNSGVVRGNT